MKKVLALALALAMMSICAFAFAEEITLNVWSFTNELQGMIEKYYLPSHPDVKINFTIYPTDGGEYTSHVDTLMAADGNAADAPDIFTLEAAFVKKYTDSDWTADLKEVGFTDEEISAALPAMKEIGMDTRTGAQKGLSWQSTPGSLMYRADLAEKYLGVTSPEEMAEKVADWDTFMETAEELKEASQGACKMFCAPGDIFNAYKYNRENGWVVDGKLCIDDVMLDELDLLKTSFEEDLDAKGTAWTETWFAGMNGTSEILCYFLPTWGLHYTLKPNCVVGGAGDRNDEELAAYSAENGGTFGLWRMTNPPVAYSWGGTWMGANAAKVAAADDAKKAAIKDLIWFFTLNDEFLYTYAHDSGDFVGSKPVVDKIVAEGGTPNPFLGGQDHYGMFAEAAAIASGKTWPPYDETMDRLWNDQATLPYIRGEKTLDEAIAGFKSEVKAAFADLVVE